MRTIERATGVTLRALLHAQMPSTTASVGRYGVARQPEMRAIAAWPRKEPDARLSADKSRIDGLGYQHPVDVGADDVADDSRLYDVAAHQFPAEPADVACWQYRKVAECAVPPDNLHAAKVIEKALITSHVVGIVRHS